MKAIINLDNKNSFFNNRTVSFKKSNWLLNIVNKPYLEYLLDFCIINNATDIIINQQDEDTSIRKSFNTGEKWGVNLRYTFSKSEDSESDIVRKNKAFIGTDSIIFINSGFFLHYDKNNVNTEIFSDSWKLMENNSIIGFFLRTVSDFNINILTEISKEDLPYSRIESFDDFFKLSMNILNDTQSRYFLPGYSNEDNVLVGENVEIPKSARLIPPIAIGDNVQFKNYVQIGPNVMVGNNCIIDNGTLASDSIIFSNTYIGSNLEIREKIFCENTIISPKTGESLELVDKQISTSTTQNVLSYNFIFKIFSSIYLVILSVLLCIPYFLFRVFNKKKIFETVEVYTDANLNRAGIKKAKNPNRYFYRFMLDKFINFPLLLSTGMNIVGNTPVSLDDDVNIITSNEKYFPGLISYTEILNIEEDELAVTKQIHELYYSHNKSLVFDLKILCKFFIRRLFLSKY